MFKSLGIGARLFIAFLCITALSLSSGITSWFIFRDISEAQFQMNSVALPAVAAMQRTSEASARLVASAPALTAAKDESSRLRQDAELGGMVNEIRQSLAIAGFSALDRVAVDTLTKAVDSLVSNLAVQNALVKRRLVLQKDFNRRADLTIAAATSIIDLSETLVSNSSASTNAVIANLYGLIDEPTLHNQAYEALDRLIEQDIYQLDRMSELRLRSSQIGLLINRLTRAIDQSEVKEITQGFNEHLRVVRRRISSIDDPVRQAQAETFLAVLDDSNGTTPFGASLFGQREELLSIGIELEKVAETNLSLSYDVSRVTRAMLSRSERFARTSAADADKSLNTGLVALVVSSVLAIILSGLIVWLYVERSVVRRITNVSDAMRRLTEGDLNVEMKQEGTDELRALSEAVTAFRDESRQRRALEIERNRTNEELRRHREELQVLVADRTQKLRDEVELHAEARARAESASQAKSEFLAVMSHEIRTPMTGMLGMLRILTESRLSQKQKNWLMVASSSGEALLGILNSILDYSKIESGKVTHDPVPMVLKDVMSGVIDLMQPAAAEKSLSLVFEMDPTLSGVYLADAAKLRQIVFNLIGNAIKFTEAGRIELRIIKTGETGLVQNIRINVSDTGIGISDEDRDGIFESFSQKDATITRRYGGTGLGLAISKRYAEIMGGTLVVSSNLGEGSMFSLEICLPTVAGTAVETIPNDVPMLDGGSMLHILVVEDDPATRIVAQEFLQKMGHYVDLAHDGYSAVARVAEKIPDLVLMDISLPGIDGSEAARLIRKIAGAETVPIIAMSAHVDNADSLTGRSSEMDAFVVRAFDPGRIEPSHLQPFGCTYCRSNCL